MPQKSHEIAGQLGEEMKAFSKRLQERKEKERIQDLANTSSLPTSDLGGGGNTSRSKGIMQGARNHLAENDLRGRTSSFNQALTLEQQEEIDAGQKKRDDLLARLERIKTRKLAPDTKGFSPGIGDDITHTADNKGITLESILSLPL